MLQQISRWYKAGTKAAMGTLHIFQTHKNQNMGKVKDGAEYDTYRKQCIYSAYELNDQKEIKEAMATGDEAALVKKAFDESMSNTCLIHFLATIPVDDGRLYHQWVLNWKAEYKSLSQLIRECKRMRKTSLNKHVHYQDGLYPHAFCYRVDKLKELANKMLIARRNGKMARRALRRLTNI